MPNLKLRDGTTIYYKDWGSGPPVVFSHGWPLSSDMWEYQMMFLADQGYRVIAHDRRGAGRSDQVWDGYTYDRFADDLAELIEALDLREVTLVGFSMGGGETARYIGRHGTERIARAALLGAVTPRLIYAEDYPEGIPSEVCEGVLAGIKADRAEFFRGLGQIFYGAEREDASISEGLLAQYHQMDMQGSLKSTHDCVIAFSETDFRTDLAAFDVPVLLVHGDDDSLVPLEATTRQSLSLISDAELIVYEGAAHGFPFTHKDRLNSDLLAFIAGR